MGATKNWTSKTICHKGLQSARERIATGGCMEDVWTYVLAASCRYAASVDTSTGKKGENALGREKRKNKCAGCEGQYVIGVIYQGNRI